MDQVSIPLYCVVLECLTFKCLLFEWDKEMAPQIRHRPSQAGGKRRPPEIISSWDNFRPPRSIQAAGYTLDILHKSNYSVWLKPAWVNVCHLCPLWQMHCSPLSRNLCGLRLQGTTVIPQECCSHQLSAQAPQAPWCIYIMTRKMGREPALLSRGVFARLLCGFARHGW